MIFIVGSNDLTAGQPQAWTVADRLLDLAKVAREEFGVQEVAICSVLDRVEYPDILPPYPTKVRQFNKYVKTMAESEQHITYWRHARMVKVEGMLLEDGVHLDKGGNGKLHKSLRSLTMALLRKMSRVN